MEALILSCGTGGGHDAAGRAVRQELLRRGHRVEMLNPYALRGRGLSGGIDKTYIRLARDTPQLFGGIYHLGDLYRKLPCRSPVYFANRGMIRTMERYFRDHPTDVVIMPHLFPAEILTAMKDQGLPVPKTMFIATDYACIPFTEETKCDAYVIPSSALAEEFAARGIPTQRLYPLGIPTAQVFDQNLSREEARRQLGLDPEKKYVLVAGGSMGGGKLEKTIHSLCRGLQGLGELVVVCGSNRKLCTSLTERYGSEMRVVGQTNRMGLYVQAADLFVTKPGGLSSTEAAVAGTPVVHITPIPGCETCNARYFSHKGMSCYCRTVGEILPQVRRLLTDPETLEAMGQAQREFIARNAACRICDLAEDLVKN